MDLTSSLEDYLKAVLVLYQQNGYVRCVDVAEHLDVSKPSVSRAMKELIQSFELIREAIGKIPDGPVNVPVKGNPNGEFFVRIEQPRGEAIYYVKGSGTKYLDRFRLRTPTTSNIPPMVEMLKGCQLADVPLLILTIDPCVSCTER